MEREDLQRALIAVILSFIILIGYQYFFVKPVPKETQKPDVVKEQPRVEKERETLAEPEEERLPVAPQPSEVSMPKAEKIVKVDTPLFAAEVSSRGAVIKKWLLKKYSDKEGLPILLSKEVIDIAPLLMSRDDSFVKEDLDFAILGHNLRLNAGNPTGTITFVHESEGRRITRTMTFYADTYKVDVTERVRGIGTYWVTLGEDLGITGVAGYGTHIGPVLLTGTEREEYTPGKLKEPVFVTSTDLKWIAQEDKYFFSSVVPLSEIYKIKIWKRQNTGLVAFQMGEGENNYVLYAGPKVIDDLKSLNLGLEHIVDFGFFSILARPIFWLLKYINNYVGNFGWSIIILTILLRIPFIPLLNKGQRSMKKLQEIQPKMAAIKEKYKKDAQRANKEMMELYKKYKVNPMGGCLPMLIQIPFFFALYKVLLIAIELRGAPFVLWIEDLSAKDPYYVLPIVMGLTMLLQQKMTPTSADPRQAKIMMFMPVVFTFLFLNFSSGLVLYWLMSNVLSIIQQFFVNKKVAKEAA